MKKLYLITLLLSAFFVAQAQNAQQFAYNRPRHHGGPGGHGTGTNSWYTPPAPMGMSSYDFENLKRCISSQAFDDSRLTIAKQGVTANMATSCQVKEIMRLFSFESNRLCFAKYAYGFVVDPQNYYEVNSAFVFSSSVEELNSMISGSCQTNSNVGVNHYYDGNNGGNPGHCGNVIMPVDNCEFGKIRSSIENQSFESTRLSVAKQIVRSKVLRSDQVKQIMDVFSFESTRLEFAKYAYRYVYDSQNYFLVNDAFVFSSSVDDLDRFMNGF